MDIHFTTRLREARRFRGNMTITKLAELTGVNRSSISSMQSGRRTPGTINIIRLAKALSVSTDWLLGVEKISVGYRAGQFDMRERAAAAVRDTDVFIDGNEGGIERDRERIALEVASLKIGDAPSQ